MADITVTAASVVPVAGFGFLDLTAGATITAGQTVYIDTANSNVAKLADADASALTATVAGVALHSASTSQPIRIITSGDYNPGATLVAGKLYVQSSTAGGIAPVADLTTGWRTSIIGVATTTSNMSLVIKNTGVTN
jgi:hypothetical protein